MLQFSLHKKLHSPGGVLQLQIKCAIQAGEFISISGASGTGKTSVLRMLAGFIDPDEGHIQYNNEVWFDSNSKINLPPQKRKVGFVFQDYALFPNMSVKQNLLYALPKNTPLTFVDELLHLVELEGLNDKNVQQLSGGQKQRVALARALATKPSLLMMDEPLSAADAELRLRLQQILRKVKDQYHLTCLLISHDVPEISRLSDRVILIENGRIKSEGTPSEVFGAQPAETFRLSGEIILIETNNVSATLHILAGGNIIKVTKTAKEVQGLQRGDIMDLTF